MYITPYVLCKHIETPLGDASATGSFYASTTSDKFMGCNSKRLPM